jgi:hypothetical protein
MNWEVNAVFRKRKENFQKKARKEGLTLKKKEKCYNCDKEGYFARKCRLSKTNYAKTDNPKKERGRKIQKKP